MEARRIRLMVWALFGLVVALTSFVGSLILMPSFPPWSGFLPLILIGAGFVAWFAWQIQWTTLQLDWKEAVVVPAVAAWREGWQLHPSRGLSKKAFAASGLSNQQANHYYAEDLVTGVVGSVKVEIAEVRATRTSGSGSRTRSDLLFQGALAQATVGTAPWSGRYFLQRVGLNSALAPLPGRVVPIDLPGWQLRWKGEGAGPDVWTQPLLDRVEAAHRSSGINFRISWDGSRLWIGTTSLIDLWEPPLWSPLGDSRIQRGLQVLEMVDALVQAFTYAETHSSTNAASLGSTLS